MKIQRFAAVLTLLNLVLLLVLLSQIHSVGAQGTPGVLRGRGLEIVDERGKVRAQLIVQPPAPTAEGHMDTEGGVILRLMFTNGRPAVKLGAGVDGSGMSLAGDAERREWDGIQILAKTQESSIKITNKDGRVQVVK